ncbi:MAG: RimK family alpha-L-glutamate ligase [Planctomycetota bacterium]|nr:RimK family alpha-L-glutamate ligase [Planctomycetota bacterium]MDI6788448.1 RimK family alpha-L-glutamate ligase [Planctomycetota bacterium]
MKILILSRDANYYSTRRLVEEAHQRRHQVQVADPLQCNIFIQAKPTLPHKEFLQNKGLFSISANNQDLSDIDIAIPRTGIIGIDYALLVLHQLELVGKPLLNSASALSITKNKFHCLQILCKAGIPIPDTMMTHNSNEVKATIKKLGGLPVILKLFRGSQGKGVILGENISAIQSILTAVWAIGYDILLQKYLRETKGRDIRILVLSNEVITAMRRIPAKGEFRSNLHQGGSVKKISPTREENALALEATKTLGLNLAGVDIMRTRKGPLVLEINGSPGFEGLEKITGMNIARRIIDFTTTLSNHRY